jgi:hypothetical protein
MTAFDRIPEPSDSTCINGGIHTCPGGARPPMEAMISFVDAYRDDHGVMSETC